MLLGAITAALLSGFFAFVGYHKAFSPLAVLAGHRLWTLELPELLGRTGWSEMLAALLTIFWRRHPKKVQVATQLLIRNQGAAALVHFARGETDALPQNAAIVMPLAFLAWAASRQP